MKFALLAFFGLVSASAFAGDAVMVEGVSCAVNVRLLNSTLFNFGEGGENRLELGAAKSITLRDSAGRNWDFYFTNTFVSPWDGIQLPSGELIVKKNRLDDQEIRFEISTDAFKRKLRGKGAEIFTDTYVITAGATPGSGKLRSYSGSFSSQIATFIDCDVKKREVQYSDYDKKHWETK